MSRILDGPREGGRGIAQGGLSTLFGPNRLVGGQRVRDYVVEVALGAIAEAFGLDGVVLAGSGAGVGSGPGGQPDQASPLSLAARIPSAIAADSPFLFEVYGRLWARLAGVDPSPVDQIQLAGQWAVTCSLGRPVGGPEPADEPGAQLVGAAFRHQPFSEAEVDSLVRSLRSVVRVVVGADRITKGRPRPAVSASVSSASPTVSAEVTVALDEGPSEIGASSIKVKRLATSLTGTGRGENIASAIARAAANACRPQREVLFAGSSDLDGMTVTVVILQELDGAPVLGLALGPTGDHAGPAEAVFSAVPLDQSEARQAG